MKGVPCGPRAFIDGGWHSSGVSGASKGRPGHLKERSRGAQELHSFPPHLGLNNAPVSGLEAAEGDALAPRHPARGEALKGWVPLVTRPQLLPQGALEVGEGDWQPLGTTGGEAPRSGA